MRYGEEATNASTRRNHGLSRHPLYQTWYQLIRRYKPDELSLAFRNIETFVDVVGKRPSPRHIITREDPSRPWGADNFTWKINGPEMPDWDPGTQKGPMIDRMARLAKVIKMADPAN